MGFNLRYRVRSSDTQRELGGVPLHVQGSGEELVPSDWKEDYLNQFLKEWDLSFFTAAYLIQDS